MKKIFISQPMKGRTAEEIERERNEIINKIKAAEGANIEIIQSFLSNKAAQSSSLWCLGESFKKLSEAHIAYFGQGWEYARGCKLEHLACEEYGIKTKEV